MTDVYKYKGSGRIWLMCSWEYGPVCYGMALDLIGGVSLIIFLVLAIGIFFFGLFGIKPKNIRRKLHD
ncbi:unnamed protein product [Caenorhabditis sp. 36 PRJEB53466]|nr:unnamed protein product [Caenorhabditis sp. 36 PRJEB53466]